jgi:hypothetical protein
VLRIVNDILRTSSPPGARAVALAMLVFVKCATVDRRDKMVNTKRRAIRIADRR